MRGGRTQPAITVSKESAVCDTDRTPNGGPTGFPPDISERVTELLDVPPEQIRFEEGLMRYNGHTVREFGDNGWLDETQQP